jgi:hypothetical protein
MLKEIVVLYQEPFKAVQSWFAVFEFYCERPVTITMPEIPEHQDDVTILARKRPKSASTVRSLSETALHDKRSLCDAQTQARCELVRPRLRQNPGFHPGRRRELDDDLWMRRKDELKKFKMPVQSSQDPSAAR